MNLIEATADASGAGLVIGETRLPLRGVPLRAGEPVILGVRPEHLRLAEGRGNLKMIVEAVEVLGADTLAHGRIAGSDGGAATLVVRLPGAMMVEGGDVLSLAFEGDALHLFDRKTGKRIETPAPAAPVRKLAEPENA